MSTGGWIFSILATFIFLALIAALIIWLLSSSNSLKAPSGRSEGYAQEILERRLASGEITVEEYEKRRHSLSGESGAPLAGRRQESPPRAAGAASG